MRAFFGHLYGGAFCSWASNLLRWAICSCEQFAREQFAHPLSKLLTHRANCSPSEQIAQESFGMKQISSFQRTRWKQQNSCYNFPNSTEYTVVPRSKTTTTTLLLLVVGVWERAQLSGRTFLVPSIAVRQIRNRALKTIAIPTSLTIFHRRVIYGRQHK